MRTNLNLNFIAGGAKGGEKSQYPIFGSTTGRIAALLLACVASHTALRAPCTASRQRTQKRHIGYFRLPKGSRYRSRDQGTEARECYNNGQDPIHPGLTP